MLDEKTVLTSLVLFCRRVLYLDLRFGPKQYHFGRDLEVDVLKFL